VPQILSAPLVLVIVPGTIFAEKLQALRYRVAVERHLELVEVHPALGFGRVEVVVEVACGEAERLELSVGRQQQCR